MKKSGCLFLFLLFFTILRGFSQQQQMQPPGKEYSILALGDSYTIGESVDEADRFPNQTVLFLHSKGVYFDKPVIIATTGWTTDELMQAIRNSNLLQGTFDFVTLLIGVNNQYRGRSAEEYRKEFVELLTMATRFSGDQVKHVIVLSIPDWGVMPFAEGRDRKKIAEEIDFFNAINKEESLKLGVNYIDITPISRKALNDPSLIAPDGLHPSAKMYAEWARLVEQVIAINLK